MTDVLMESCPHFEGCNAPLCPLHPAGRHLENEPVCRLAREVVKVGGEAHVAGYVPPEVYAGLIAGLPRLRAVHYIDQLLTRAALTPMRKSNLGAYLLGGNKAPTHTQTAQPPSGAAK